MNHIPWILAFGCYIFLASGQQASKIFLQYEYETAWIHTPGIFEGGNGRNCSQPLQFPVNRFGAEAQVIADEVAVCGGYFDHTECFSLYPALNAWVELPSLDVERGYSASVVTPDGWWITGGAIMETSMSTSSLFDGTSWTRGPDLPSRRRWHCMAQVNETHYFMGGGNNGYTVGNLSDAYLMNWSTQQWIELPTMPTSKYTYGCGLHVDATLGPLMMTAGGYESPTSVEALNLSTLEWLTLPSLPVNVTDGKLLNDGADLILFRGESGSFLRYNDADQTFSVLEGQILPVFGYGMSVLAITDEQLFGCS